MYGLGSLSLVLMIAAFFPVCTTGNSEERNKQKCQGSVIKLKCLNKSYALSIVTVFYGRVYPGSNICKSPYSNLSDELRCKRNENNVTTDVRKLCEEKNSCNFTIESSTFSTPDKCPKVYKYMHIDYKCVEFIKSKRHNVARPVTHAPSLVKTTSTVTTSSKTTTRTFTSTEVIKPTSTMIAIIDQLLTTHQSQESVPRSSSLSSSRAHSVSVTTVSHTQQSPSSTLEIPSLKTTKPTSKTYENSAISADRHGSMKLFRFIVSFHIIREETIEKRTASSVLWFLFGLLVGFLIMIAVLVYYRVKRARQGRKDRPNKEAYMKQKNWSDGTIEENTILHPKQLEVLEMESQLGETV